MRRADAAFLALAVSTAAALAVLLPFVFLRVPVAQPEAGGLAQKIFYFHVPAAYAMYLSGVVCGVASGAYLARPTPGRDALAHAGAEVAVVFGAMVLASGPLWARKAWGVYWTWDPRLTTLLLSVLVYGAIVLLRSFAAGGDAERRFAAAIGVLGTVNLPIIHYSVRKWGGNHPTVVGQGGGGLRHPDMATALGLGFLAITLLTVILLWSRARLLAAHHRVTSLEERVLTAEISP